MHLVQWNSRERKQIESEKSKDTQNTDISKRTLNNYTVTSCGDAKIYWVQLSSSSLRRLHIALRNLIYFCIKNKSIASTLCAQLFSTITLNHHWIKAISSWQHKQLLRSYLSTWPLDDMLRTAANAAAVGISRSLRW